MAVICGNALRAHHGVVAENPSKVVLVGKYILLQRQENTCRINQIDGRDPVLQGDGLGPENLFRGHGEEGAGFDSGIIGDNHHQPPRDPSQAGHHPRGRRATPLLIHAKGGKETQLQEILPGIKQQGQPFPGRQTLLAVLRLNSLGASALANDLLLLP